MLTLRMMGLTTFLFGCIPSYETWGIAAPILILLMRAMQGLAHGDAATYIAEHAPDGWRGLYTSWIQSSPQRSAPYSSGTTFIFTRRCTALPRSDEALKIKF